MAAVEIPKPRTAAMRLFKQITFKPGRYRVGNGRYKTFTAQDLSEYVAGTNAILKAGGSISLPTEHPPIGSDQGSARFSRAEQFADAIENAGWLDSVYQDDKGRVVTVFNVTSQKHAEAIDNGTIRFTSPEFREHWEDTEGRQFGRHFSHFALTPRPRHVTQDRLKPLEACQFSLEDFADDGPVVTPPPTSSDATSVATMDDPSVIRALLKGLGEHVPDDLNIDDLNVDSAALISSLKLVDSVRKKIDEKKKAKQIAEEAAIKTAASGPMQAAVGDEENGEQKKPEEAAVTPIAGEPKAQENPDLPPSSQDAQVDQAIIANLAELGVQLPASFDLAKDKSALLAALKTLVVQKQEAEQKEKQPGDEAGVPPITEERPMPTQFSAEAQQVIGKQNEQLATFRRERLLSAVNRVPLPGIRSKLVERLESVQFADDGNEQPLLTIGEVAELLSAGLPRSLRFSDTTDGVTEEDMPSEDPNRQKQENAKETAKAVVQETGYAPRGAKQWESSAPQGGVAAGAA